MGGKISYTKIANAEKALQEERVALFHAQQKNEQVYDAAIGEITKIDAEHAVELRSLRKSIRNVP